MVVHISTGISLVFCLIMSIAGYLSFTDKTQANILNNLASVSFVFRPVAPGLTWASTQNDFMGNLARFCIGMNMTTTLPLECFVCREVGDGAVPRRTSELTSSNRRSSSSRCTPGNPSVN